MEIYTKYKLRYLSLIGGKVDCLDVAKSKLSDKDRASKKKAVYNHLLKNVFKTASIDNLDSDEIKETFMIIDKTYFDGELYDYIKRNRIHVEFVTSERMSKTAGICKYAIRSNKPSYQIGVSSKILHALFDKGEKSLKINGVQCTDRLSCYINIFEHELIHLLLLIFCPELGQEKGGHTDTFMAIANNLFGHTKYKHMLLSGDYETMKEQKKEIKTNVEIGDTIISKEINGKTYQGVVKNISKKSVTVELDDGKLIRLYYPAIAKIEGKKKMIKKTDTKTIKPKEGDKVRVKISGKIQTGIIIKVNPTRLRVKMTDGKEWYVPVSMILELV